MTPAEEARVRALAERVRRKIAEHGDEYPEPSDEQIRAVAALLPPVRHGGSPGQPEGGDDDEPG
jgi:hypothetical protein